MEPNSFKFTTSQLFFQLKKNYIANAVVVFQIYRKFQSLEKTLCKTRFSWLHYAFLILYCTIKQLTKELLFNKQGHGNIVQLIVTLAMGVLTLIFLIILQWLWYLQISINNIHYTYFTNVNVLFNCQCSRNFPIRPISFNCKSFYHFIQKA